MARGEVATIEHAELPKGSVITTSGRISGVTEPGEVSVHYPFSIKDLVVIDDALKYGSRTSNARFKSFSLPSLIAVFGGRFLKTEI